MNSMKYSTESAASSMKKLASFMGHVRNTRYLRDDEAADMIDNLENRDFFSNHAGEKRNEEMPQHQNCRSITLAYRKPDGKETIRSMVYLQLKLYMTPWWRFRERLELKNAIRQEIINGIVWGHFIRKERENGAS